MIESLFNIQGSCMVDNNITFQEYVISDLIVSVYLFYISQTAPTIYLISSIDRSRYRFKKTVIGQDSHQSLLKEVFKPY